jgi:ubiquinone biosynthesis protein UbiJ
VRHLSALAANGFAAKDELAALRAERDRLRERLDRLRAAFS